MAKKMVVNCGTCDARNVMEETLQTYEKVVINSGTVLVTPESKVLLDRYGAALNCGNVVEVPRDARVSTVNGSLKIKAADTPAEKTFLMLNGSLEIGPGTQEALKLYRLIVTNDFPRMPYSRLLKISVPARYLKSEKTLTDNANISRLKYPLQTK